MTLVFPPVPHSEGMSLVVDGGRIVYDGGAAAGVEHYRRLALALDPVAGDA